MASLVVGPFSSLVSYSLRSIWISWAVSPVNITTAINDTPSDKIEFFKNKLRIMTVMTPKMPILKKDPIAARSFFAEYPYKLIPKNITADVAKRETMLWCWYTRKILDNDNPITLEYKK
jgi:hypothetical protein